MSDRFKFRCWNKLQNKMFYVINISWFYEKIKRIEAFEPETKKIFIFDEYDQNIENTILMQCTGLKDKNGKLIYEGDVIVIPNQYPFYDYKNKEESQNLNDTYGEIKGETILNYVGVVEYIFNGWQYVLNCVNPLKRGISNGINYLLNEQGFEEDENSCYEVIGNIYENPELLKECE